MLEIVTVMSRMYTSSGIRHKTRILTCPNCNKSLRFQTAIGQVCYHCRGIVPIAFQLAHKREERLKYHVNI